MPSMSISRLLYKIIYSALETEVPVIAQMYSAWIDVIQLTNHRNAFKTNILLVIIYKFMNISLRNHIHLAKSVGS